MKKRKPKSDLAGVLYKNMEEARDSLLEANRRIMSAEAKFNYATAEYLMAKKAKSDEVVDFETLEIVKRPLPQQQGI